MNTVLIILLCLLVFEFLVGKILGFLNKTALQETLPKDLEYIYDAEKYSKMVQYEKAKYNFGLISGIFQFVLMLGLVVFGVFGRLYDYLATITTNEIIRTLYFVGILAAGQSIISLPFSYYSNFVIEQKFGFNTMKKSLFFKDFIKGILLSAVIGGLIISALVFIYLQTGTYFWIIAWGLMSMFSIFMMMFYSSLIVPIFNKQTPLESGQLRDAIEAFATKVGFKLDNIYVIDGSTRSKKANAYFSGFGPKKRIVLYDTLIKDLSIEELVAVLAHEIGHYKKKHTLQMLAFSLFQTAVIFYILGLSLNYEIFSQALGSTSSVAVFALGLISFSILFTPVSMVFGVVGNILSRKNEYEADAYAKKHYGAEYLSSALIKLTKNNLSNLTPHPAYEFFYYSHPRVLKRLKALQK